MSALRFWGTLSATSLTSAGERESGLLGSLIEEQLTALESERSTMGELVAQTQRELVDLPAASKKRGLSQRRELCEMFFPDGLVWSHSGLASPAGFEPAFAP